MLYVYRRQGCAASSLLKTVSTPLGMTYYALCLLFVAVTLSPHVSRA